MDALDAVLPLVAVAAPTAVVLREIVTYDRPRARAANPAAPPPTEPVAPPVAAPVARRVVAPDVVPPPDPVASPVTAPVTRRVVEPEVVEPETADDETPESMLARLTTTETDERSWLRRMRALLVVIVLTLATAALVGAGIYRAVSRLG